MKNFKYILALVTVSFSLLFISCEEEGITENGLGVLTGTVVTKGDNVPLQNVKITSSPSSNTVFTNSAGEFTIEPISAGDYSIQAELTDYVTAFKPAVIIEGESTNVVFELELSNGDNVPPIAPELIFPEDNATEVPTQVDFIWSSAMSDDDIVSYIFELRNGSTNEIVMSESLQDTTFTVNNLTIGVNYFWQVLADDSINEPVASDISSFRTEAGANNRFFYTRSINGANVIFSGNDTADSGDSSSEIPNEDEVQLTLATENSFRPRMNRVSNKIAFLRTVGPEIHVFTMDVDGTNVNQVTSTIPVAGFDLEEVDISWFADGSKIYYTNFNELYSINIFGAGTTLVYEAPENRFITEVDTNEVNQLLAIKTNDVNGYNARIVILDPNTGDEEAVVIENEPGALGGIDYSIDGSKLLYVRDVSGFESPAYKQLDSRIFEYTFATSSAVDLSGNKEPGTNDLDAKYSPTEGKIIFNNAPNDGFSIGDIYSVVNDDIENRELLFTNAYMPDWE